MIKNCNNMNKIKHENESKLAKIGCKYCIICQTNLFITLSCAQKTAAICCTYENDRAARPRTSSWSSYVVRTRRTTPLYPPIAYRRMPLNVFLNQITCQQINPLTNKGTSVQKREKHPFARFLVHKKCVNGIKMTKFGHFCTHFMTIC